MNELKMAAIGMGPRGRRVMRTFSLIGPHVKFTAVCDKIEALARLGLTDTNNPKAKAYTDCEKMLRETDAEAVLIAVEPENNADLVLLALEKGKHVCSEVPLSFDLDRCLAVVRMVKKTGLKYVMTEQVSYTPMVRAWKSLVDEGRIGKPLLAEGQYLHGMAEDRLWLDRRTGERLTRSQAKDNPDAIKSRIWNNRHPIWYLPHNIGPFLHILSDRVRRVSCYATQSPSCHYPELPIPDLEVALMHTERDVIIRQANGFACPTAEPFHWFHLLGTAGELETARQGHNTLTEPGLWWFANNYMAGRQPVKWSYTHTQPHVPGAERSGHDGNDFYPLEDFVHAVLDHRHQPIVDVYRAAEISAIGICAGLSAEQNGSTIDIPDYKLL